MARRRTLALMLCALMALSVAASSTYLALEAAHPHHCAGKDCAVCRFIADLGRTLRGLVLLALCVLGAVLLRAARRGRSIAAAPVAATLIARRVRLND